MPPTTLNEKLARMRRMLPKASQSAAVSATGLPSTSDELSALERSLLGETGDALPLKARLERLIAVANTRQRQPRRTSRPLEDLVGGRVIENTRGRFLLVEEDRPLDTPHGAVPLSRLLDASPRTLAILTGEPGFASFDFSQSVFLDTETTGLAGGTGTAAFLVGLGFASEGRFVVRQYFMRDYDEEAALLHALAEDLSGFSTLVTFNGKMFDVPLLESRFRLNRARFPLAAAAHLDLLHPARRLWRARLSSCRLVHLEAQLLGLEREDDVPGEEIPQVYFDFIRGGDAGLLARVFEHNRLDIVSLAALSALACQWVEEGRAEEPRDVLSLARVLERAEDHERSDAEYRRALQLARPGPDDCVRRASLARLAARAKRGGDVLAAVEYWQQAVDAGEFVAFRELAVLHEHYRRDLAAALEVVERGLARLLNTSATPSHLTRDLRHRRERLRRRLVKGTR
jgi:uncharacterized protein YprB with RNaseH-like and TPR domain